jgi:hypothetical protein
MISWKAATRQLCPVTRRPQIAPLMQVATKRTVFALTGRKNFMAGKRYTAGTKGSAGGMAALSQPALPLMTHRVRSRF